MIVVVYSKAKKASSSVAITSIPIELEESSEENKSESNNQLDDPDQPISLKSLARSTLNVSRKQNKNKLTS